MGRACGEGAAPTARVGGASGQGARPSARVGGSSGKRDVAYQKVPGACAEGFWAFSSGRAWPLSRPPSNPTPLGTLRTRPFSIGHAHRSPYGDAISPDMAKEGSARPRMAQNGLTVGQIWPTMTTSHDMI